MEKTVYSSTNLTEQEHQVTVMSFSPCPICGSQNNRNLVNLTCGNLDRSALYPVVRLTNCSDCGHTYNNLLLSEITGLTTYYNEEYAPTNLHSVVKTGDLPGSSSTFTQDRYNQLFKFLSPHIKNNAAILDVGCAVGGFLQFLKNKGYTNLFGVEPTIAYLEQARLNGYNVRSGHAENLGFEENMFDALVIEQVMEHLIHPATAFQEAARVLKKNGILCIGVPDASKYGDFYYFDFYWLLMREHVQHFTINSLSQLAIQQGFELIDYKQSALPLMGASMIMPNLSASFQFNGQHKQRKPVKNTPVSQEIQKYVDKELSRLQRKRLLISSLVKKESPVYIWGIGREFLYLYEEAGLKQCNIRGLIDLNPFKQENVTVKDIKISPAKILKQAPQNSTLIIGALAHKKDILQRIKKLGYQGEVLDLQSVC